MKKAATAIVSVILTGIMSCTVFAAPPVLEPLEPLKEIEAPEQPLVSESTANMDASSFASNTSDTSRPQDEGKIFVGYAITNGQLDEENSGWQGSIQNMTLNSAIEGAGFTAVRVYGKGDAYVTGKLELTDSSDGQTASDLTGTGAGITAADGANVVVYDMDYYSEGFARDFAVVEDSSMIVQNSGIIALGSDPLTTSYEEYHNSDNTSMMISPPWVLGIQGGARAVNVLGEGSSLIVADSMLTAGGWGAVSTQNCGKPYLWFFNSTLNILPQSAAPVGCMDSGWEILGYDTDAYGSGYGTSITGGAQEYFYGVTINGATCASILEGGNAWYQGLKSGETYTAVYGDTEAEDASTAELGSYAAPTDTNTVINTVFGFMGDGSGSISVLDRTAVNTAESSFLYRSGDSVWTADNARLYPGNGIIFQMIDNEAAAVGGSDPFGTYLEEEAGFPTEGYVSEEQNTVVFNMNAASYSGDIYNATGYYNQAGDILTVNIGEDASLKGDIALSSHVHGIWLNGRKVDSVISAIEETNARHADISGYYADTDPITYVLLDKNGEITEDKEQAYAVQFTKFSVLEYYLLGHVLNMVHNNGQARIDVNVEGSWQVSSESLINSLIVGENAMVRGKIQEMPDGSLLILPGEEKIEAGIYGTPEQLVLED